MTRTALKKPTNFAGNAVDAYEQTYQSLFNQAHVEVDRLNKVNGAMHALEQQLLDPERIAHMDVSQQLALAELLNRTSNNTIKNLMGFGNLFMNIRTVVGLLDGIQKSSNVLPGTSRPFPGIEHNAIDGRVE